MFQGVPISKSPTKEWRESNRVEFQQPLFVSMTPMPKMPTQYTQVSPLIKEEKQPPFRMDQQTRERI